MRPFRFRPGQPVVWFHRALSRSNQHCLYCGELVGVGSVVLSNKEHLIARQFVPKGYLEGDSFNFIFRACNRCNKEKDSAERHLSSVTLFSSPARKESEEIERVAARKAATDFHPEKKGTLIKDASEHATVKFRFGAVSMSFGISGPPRPRDEDVALLACRHVQGLFSLVTTTDPTRAETTRLLLGERVFFHAAYPHSDWGNPELRALSERVAAWETPAHVSTARGFFKAVLRRPPIDAHGWFWALEWNKSWRIVGGIAERQEQLPIFDELPNVGWFALPNGTGRMREETPLPEGQDSLFAPALTQE